MQDIINQWNRAALKYTEAQEDSEFVESNKRVVKARFEHFSGEKVLDLGCGYGFYTDILARLELMQWELTAQKK